MNIDMTDEQTKVVAELRDPYLKINEGIVVAMEVEITGQVKRYVIHPDGNYHIETLHTAGRGWNTTFSTLGCDSSGRWLETNTLQARFYDRLTVGDLIGALAAIPSEQYHLPIYAFDGRTGDHVPLMEPTLYDESEPHSIDNPLSMTLDRREVEHETSYQNNLTQR